MKIRKEIVEYIFRFMLRDKNIIQYVSYGEPREKEVKICIVPAQHFWDNYGNSNSIPELPLKKWRGTDILFGSIQEKNQGGVRYVYADVVASSFFLLSRYEEMVLDGNRDHYGRYKGEGSILGRTDNMGIPLVDLYGEILREQLRSLGVTVQKTEKRIRNVYLTHDVDDLWQKINFKTAVKSMVKTFFVSKRLSVAPILNSMGIYKWNNLDSFDFLNSLDEKAADHYKDHFEKILFLIATEEPCENTNSYITNKKFGAYKQRFNNMDYKIGVHYSYPAGEDLALLEIEKKRLQEILGGEVIYGRHHYLRSLAFDELRILEQLGIKKDFTMGYADKIGFRLGTTRAVRWIDPERMVLTDIELQPLNIMDGTLYEAQYLNLNYNEAVSHCRNIIDTVKRVNGDFCFLIHNNNIYTGSCSWLKKLYCELIDILLAEKENILRN